MKKKIVIGITGASGAIYAEQLLKKLTDLTTQVEKYGIVMSRNAPDVWEFELQNKQYQAYDNHIYESTNFNAPFASGSAGYDAMIIIPCSMGTMSRIANGVSSDLLTRSADVMLKERKKLICVIRETPYNLIHIRNMETITLAGGIICPASPAFYQTTQKKDIEHYVGSVVDRSLQLAGLNIKAYKWQEEEKE